MSQRLILLECGKINDNVKQPTKALRIKGSKGVFIIADEPVCCISVVMCHTKVYKGGLLIIGHI